MIPKITGAGAFAIALTVAMAAGAAAAWAGPADQATADDAAASVGRICRSTVGVFPGERHFNACVASLSDSQHLFSADMAMARAHRDCMERGLTPGSPSFSECVLAGRSEIQASAPAAVSETAYAAPARSLFSVSPGEAHRREEASCAALGIDPASEAFVQCVTNLQVSLFAADHPMN